MSFSTCLSLQVLSQKACWCNIRFSNTAERALSVLPEYFYTSPWLAVWACFNICEFAFNSFITPIIPTSEHLGLAREALHKNMLKQRSVLHSHPPSFSLCTKNIFKVNSGSSYTVIQCPQDQGPRMQQGFVAVKLSES